MLASKKVYVPLLALLSATQCAFAFSMRSVVSPVPGVWANKQPLVLALEPGEEAFYSFTGSDPLSSGFAYDGPVLIDRDGAVDLRLAVVADDGQRQELRISYEVVDARVEALFGGDEPSCEFLRSVCASPLVRYVNGSVFSIPGRLLYFMGQGTDCWSYGADVRVSEACNVARFVPCTVTDPGKAWQWRFVLSALPVTTGTFSRKTVPFLITDWTTVTFTDRRLIYRIDDDCWTAGLEPLELDRSAAHIIQWQSIEYEEGNPVSTFVLPPKPQLDMQRTADGAQCFSVSGGENFGVAVQELGIFREVVVDTFAGDDADGTLELPVFYDTVYQGTLTARYRVDRQPPPAPVFDSHGAGLFSRRDVSLGLSSEPGTLIYYHSDVSRLTQEDVDDLYSGRERLLFDGGDIALADLYSGAEVTLGSDGDGPVLHRIASYARDAAGNTSMVAYRAFIIDSTNFYLDEGAAVPDGRGDGSRMRPFTRFSQALEAINAGRFTRLYVQGTVHVDARDAAIYQDCQIVGLSEARIVFPEDAGVRMSACSVEIRNCLLERDSPDSESKQGRPLLSASCATLVLDGSEIVTAASAGVSAIHADASVVSLQGAIVTSRSDFYTCALTAVSSRLSVRDSRIIAMAPTAVCLSASGNAIDMSGSACTVIGNIGRVMELTGVRASMKGNTFVGQLKSSAELHAVWRDSGTVVLLDQANEERGFN